MRTVVLRTECFSVRVGITVMFRTITAESNEHAQSALLVVVLMYQLAHMYIHR